MAYARDVEMLIPRASRTFVALLLIFGCVIADEDAPCYLPDGTPVSGFFPCDPTAYITSCCPTGWTCYSNSMCVITDPSSANSSQPIGTSIRGSCTNPEWNNAVCGDYCLSDKVMAGNLKACGDDKFCCTDDSSCSCSDGAFVINPGRVQTIIGIEGLEHTETSTIPISTASTKVTSATTLTTAVVTSTGTDETSATATAAATAAAPGKPAINKPGVKVGIAFGVLAGVGLIAAAAVLLYKKWRKNKKNLKPPEVIPSSAPRRPPSAQDPYRSGNAANFTLIPPLSPSTRRSLDHFDASDAPYNNAYEEAASRGPVMSSSTLSGGSNGVRAPLVRPRSYVSDDEGENRYVRRGPNEMAL